MYKITRFQSNVCIPFITISFTTCWYIYKEQSPLIWLSGLCNALFLTLWVHQSYPFIFYQFLYFQIICDYLKQRLNNLNEIIIKLNKKKKSIRTKNNFKVFVALYREIVEYNATYWSKFLFLVWSLIGLPMVMEIYLLFFTNTNFIIRIVFIYAFFLYMIPFNFIKVKACSVNNEANRSYKIVNSIIVDYTSRTKETRSVRSKNLIKVIYCS